MASRHLRADEARDASRAAATGFVEATRRVEEVHRAVADRSFGAIAPITGVVRALHDRIAAGSYASVRVVGAAATRVVGEAVAARRPRDAAPIVDVPAARAALGALSGLFGDWLADQDSAIAIPTQIRLAGRPLTGAGAVTPDPATAAGTLVVFLHGLCETDVAWRRPGRAADGTEIAPYEDRLAAELAVTPLQVVYNSGRHISSNGRDVAALVEQVVASWPVPVERIALVGHSMGGLVARSACAEGLVAGHAWVGRVRQVVYLGTPHVGAPLERAANRAAALLERVPEARPVASVLRARSVGIKDLRHGTLADEDWLDRDPDALRAAEHRDVPLLDGARHHFIGATLTADPAHPFGRALGDLFVNWETAGGRIGEVQRIALRPEDGHHLGRTNHFDLLNHPAVYERLRVWLAPGRGGAD